MLTANTRLTWSHVGPQKIDLELGMGRQDPPKMGANLGFKKKFLEAQVGFHLGGVLAALGLHRPFFGALVGPPSGPPQLRTLLFRSVLEPVLVP